MVDGLFGCVNDRRILSIWYVFHGGYLRLSREDLQKINQGLDDSNSVKNQRDILNDFHFNHAEEFESHTEYVEM